VGLHQPQSVACGGFCRPTLAQVVNPINFYRCAVLIYITGSIKPATSLAKFTQHGCPIFYFAPF